MILWKPYARLHQTLLLHFFGEYLEHYCPNLPLSSQRICQSTPSKKVGTRFASYS